jgi:glucosylceramidase
VSEEFENVGKVHALFPDKHLLFTEGCIEGGVHLNVYETGERYARNIIGDFSNWCEGFLDWNLTLNELGGPNHVGNYCDAPIISDTKTKELHYNNSYYYIGHFSKHIQAGAKRIDSVIDHEDLKVISFRNPDQTIVSIVLNQTEEDYGIALKLDNDTKEILSTKRSILTIVKRGEQVG